MDKLHGLLLIVILSLLSVIIVMLQHAPESIIEVDTLKKENNLLQGIIKSNQGRINTLLKDNYKKDSLINNQSDEVAIIYRDKIRAIDTISDDSVYQFLAKRYIK